MEDQEKFVVYQQAQKSGGPCPICDWKDGDGTRTCFYSAEIGIVTHQNSPDAVEASMTESQRSLYRSYNSLHNEFEHCHDPAHCVQSIDYRGKPVAGNFRVAHHCGGQFVQQMSVHDWVCSGCGEKTTETQPRELFWGHHHIQGDHVTCVKVGNYYKFLHSCGKGTGAFAEAYHIYCTGCNEEVKLWEHGLDYDMG